MDEMTIEQATEMLREALDKLDKVHTSREDFTSSEVWGESLQTAIVLVENCIDELEETDDEE